MSRAPFARRKEKPPEYEEVPVVGIENVQAPEESVEPGPPTESRVIYPDEPKDLPHVSVDTMEHGGELELWRRRMKQTKERPVIYGPEAIQAEIPVEPVPTVSQIRVIDHIKLHPGQTGIWREAIRPDQDQTVTTPTPPTREPQVTATPTQPRTVTGSDVQREILATLKEMKEKRPE
jgi:hypothetical protein